MLSFITQKMIGTQNERMLKRLRPLVAQINAPETEIAGWPDERFRARSAELQQLIRTDVATAESEVAELRVLLHDLPADQLKDARDRRRKARRRHTQSILDRYLPEAFAMVREASKRTIGLRHFDVQLIGGMVLHRGGIVEMATGEGKTLVATLAAYLNALTGRGVHVVTVNDYLARRDREWMGPIYEFLGLSVGAIQHGMHDADRQRSYASDITYGTNNEFAFDYLRDNMKYQQAQIVHRDFHFAIVDEVDSILVDESRTPLIISGPAEESTELYYQLDRVARRLSTNAHFTIDEKAHSIALTEEGIAKAEELIGVQNLYDFNNQRYVHHLTKALDAHHLKRRDVDYVTKDDDIVIVDEFTGRLMPGRRWSDGLHQAIEAKEGVKIQQENQTVAATSFQNYFRMYEKLAGMTGTAVTEAQEFKEIYGLDVTVIPTNRPLERINYADAVYRTEQEKFVAAVQEIVRWHRQGRPMLVGTIAIDKSEHLSAMLSSPHIMLEALRRQCESAHKIVEALRAKRPGWFTEALQQQVHAALTRPAQLTPQDLEPIVQQLATAAPKELLTDVLRRVVELASSVEAIRAGIPHHVLNAKQHEREAHIIAQAGRVGAITIATNMAGRGTDIVLGGNPDFLAEDLLQQQAAGGQAITDEERQQTLERMRAQAREEHERVVRVGGLHVIGTERHEARRIDNQLRGRSGRQGDPGSSRFYLSLEDDLMRIFAPDRIKKMMDFFQWEEGIPIEHSLLTKSIETAQKRVEVHNFEIRKQVLKFDDVMNRQREVIYDERRQVLTLASLRPYMDNIIQDLADQAVTQCASEAGDPESWDRAGLRAYASQHFGVDCPWINEGEATKQREQLRDQLITSIMRAYDAKEAHLGADVMRFYERATLLQLIDGKWKDHLYAMDALREGIGLRGYGQRDPLIEYQHEGFEMFQTMVDSIKEEALEILLKFELRPADTIRMHRVFDPARQQMVHRETAQFEGSGGTPSARPHVQRAVPPERAPSATAAVNRAMAGSTTSAPKVGRNDPCPCGSGKKYKRCHG